MPKWGRNAGKFTVKAYYAKHGSWKCTIPKPIINVLEITKEIMFIIDSGKGLVELRKGEPATTTEAAAT
jgi:hypothetical protein